MSYGHTWAKIDDIASIGAYHQCCRLAFLESGIVCAKVHSVGQPEDVRLQLACNYLQLCLFKLAQEQPTNSQVSACLSCRQSFDVTFKFLSRPMVTVLLVVAVIAQRFSASSKTSPLLSPMEHNCVSGAVRAIIILGISTVVIATCGNKLLRYRFWGATGSLSVDEQKQTTVATTIVAFLSEQNQLWKLKFYTNSSSSSNSNN